MSNAVILCTKAEKTYPSERMKKNMPKCPICGGSAYIMHDVIDGMDFGFSGGCASFYLNDEKHGIDDPDDSRCPRVDGYSFRSVYGKWLAYCKRMDALKAPSKPLEDKA